jgi:predicted nucleic acid-binding Zn ribbon protein
MHRRARQESVRVDWPSIVGDVIARMSGVDRIADGVLYVHCATPVWAHTLSLRQKDILAKIAQRIGPDVIRGIRFSSLPGGSERG